MRITRWPSHIPTPRSAAKIKHHVYGRNSAPLAEPLVVDLSGLAEPTAAHVIEAILHNSPRMRGQVEDLRRRRATRAASAIR